jgi:arylsulfatase A-like enzyme
MKRRWIALGLFLLSALALGFWPLKSKVWTLPKPPAAELLKKQAYLKRLEPASAKAPNIVLILADDLGKFDISLYGGRTAQTPNIDKIGQKGIRFADGYTASPICAPSRAAMLTGRSNNRFGMEFQPQARYPLNRLEYLAFRYIVPTDNWRVAAQFDFPDQESMDRQGLPRTEITLAEALSAAGYATAMFGKWHLGHGAGMRPNERGFQSFFGFYEAFTLFADSNSPGMVNAPTQEFSDKHIWKKGRSGTCALLENGKPVKEEKYLTFAIADRACSYIKDHKDKPFFLYLPFNAPHTPFQAPQEYYNKVKGEPNHVRRVYKAMILALDHAVGQITETLEKEGLIENTLIWFASDNGAALYALAGNNAPYRGGKLTHYEGGLNVPFMLQWKGRLLPLTFPYPTSLTDVMVTSMAAAGIPLPADRTFDGVNLLPFLDSTTKAPHLEFKWKSGPNRALRNSRYKLVVNELSHTVELFDLLTDPEERHNLAGEQAATVQSLMQNLNRWLQSLPPTLWPGIMDHGIEFNGKVYYFRV